MRLDHIAYRVRDRDKTAAFFRDAFGYRTQTEFEITLEDGSKAICVALEPPEKQSHALFIEQFQPVDMLTWDPVEYHMAPEIFVSSGPAGSLIDKWVNEWAHGIGGIHHLAYQVDDVEAKMAEWKAKGWGFTTEEALKCKDLTQVFSLCHPMTGVIYEFISRKGQHGFCAENVAKLMGSTKNIKPTD